MKGFLLFVIAKVLAFFLLPIGFIYSILTFRVGLSDYFKSVAISIDQKGNVIMSVLFNDTLRKKGGHRFGDPDETISMVLGINKRDNTLTWLGSFIAKILNKIEKDHVEKSIDLD